MQKAQILATVPHFLLRRKNSTKICLKHEISVKMYTFYTGPEEDYTVMSMKKIPPINRYYWSQTLFLALFNPCLALFGPI